MTIKSSSSNKILSSEYSQNDKDSLKYWLGDIVQFERFQPLTSSYETLKSKGLDQLSNRRLAFILSQYYDDQVNHVTKSLGDIEFSFNSDWMPILKKEVMDFKFQEYVIVSDIEIFRESTPARNVLIMNRDNFRGAVNRIKKTFETVDELQTLILEEIEN